MTDQDLLAISYRQHPIEYNVHYHDRHELICITEGSCKMSIDGKPYLAKKGDVVLICNLENHSTRILEEPYCRYVLTLDPILFQSEIGDNRLVAMFKHRGAQFTHCLSVGETDVPQLFEKLAAESKQQDDFSDSIRLCYLKALLIEICRAHSECFAMPMNRTSETILKAAGYLDAHFAEEVKIELLAEQFFIDKYYFTHCFKEITGYSPKQYLIMVRLNHAVNLLNKTELTVTEITEQCGFPDVNNFIRLFKAKFGMTPGNWRKK